MKKLSVDIYAVIGFGIISSILTFMYLSDKIDRPNLDFVAIFWLLTISHAFGAYGRKKIEENHQDKFEDLGSPEGIAVNLTEKKGRAYYNYVLSLRFRELNDPGVNMGYFGQLTCFAIAIALLLLT